MDEDHYPREILLDDCWEFTYSKEFRDRENPVIPDDIQYETEMPVPGYWDDHREQLKRTSFWSRDCAFNPAYREIDFPMGTEKPPDASLPYLVGVGWYRRTLPAPEDWKDKKVTLHVGGAALEAWVWLNGNFMAHHLGHLTPFEVELNDGLNPGEENEIVIAVANTREGISGCSIRGYKGKSGGIYRSIRLKIAGGNGRIKDCFLHPVDNLNGIRWSVELGGDPEGAQLFWTIRDKDKRKVADGTVGVSETNVSWETETFGMEPWSEHSPHLYEVEVRLCGLDGLIDHFSYHFGLRALEREGTDLLLNGRPVLLRGATDHAYFPETCTPPADTAYYRRTIGRLKEMGFNWIRFHTWTPCEEYMQAADELGMMLQVEAPNGFSEDEWLDILRTCRRHPSVVIYCCGNEVALDEEMIPYLRTMAGHCWELAPEALFNPMEALRGIDQQIDSAYLKEEELEEIVEEPFPHHARRLDQVREFSDAFAPNNSYSSFKADAEELDTRYQVYERPCLLHEIGILDSYLNLDLEHRYTGTRIGPDLYTSVRENLKKEGLLDNADLYYRNSCAWMALLRKHSFELLRKSSFISGYDLLGATDHHWHRTGYGVGMLNEFFELKPGESPDDIRKYNGESVILLDYPMNRNLNSGQVLNCDLHSSLYGSGPLSGGRVTWYFKNSDRVYENGEFAVDNIPRGAVERLGTIDCKAPSVEEPVKLTLKVSLEGGEYLVENDWDFWIFPEETSRTETLSDRFLTTGDCGLQDKTTPSGEVEVLSTLDSRALEKLSRGANMVLLGGAPFPQLPTRFGMMMGGRVIGNNATVIHDHPLTRDFPHDGYCGWQFYSMLEGGEAARLDQLSIPFDPIIEIVSTYKLIRKQAALFELKVGKGKLLVCTMNLNADDPGARYFLRLLIDYAGSKLFAPRTEAPVEVIAGLFS